MADEFSSADGDRMSGDDINVLGNARYVGQKMGAGAGGNPNRGLLDQTLPTGIVASGQDVASKDDFARGIRRDMSSIRNESLMRKERGRK